MKPRDAGFTLLEMLVALVVFGLIMAGLAQTLRFGLTAWSAGPARTVEPENLAALDAALTRMIAQARPDSMTGQPNQLAFTTRLPAGAGLRTGLADAAITAAPGNKIVLRFAPHPPGVPLTPAAPAEIENLASGVTALQAAYLRPDSGTLAWSDTWSGGGLPLLVRIHLQLADGRLWPDLIVAPTSAGMK